MSWSFSSERKFHLCQRQWYFSTVVAHHSANDPLRREAYLLSKLQSLSAWRGSLVDYVISQKVLKVPGYIPPIRDVLEFTEMIFQQQVEFAQSHRLREPGMSASKHQGIFASWFAIEYGYGVTDRELNSCWIEVSNCISNLYAMTDLVATLKSATRCILQRALAFNIGGVSVTAMPDVLVFRRRHPPLIIDWKTYRRDSTNHERQLALYALALTKCRPHKDFPSSLAFVKPTDVELLEVQLLTNKQRLYKISQEDSLDIEQFIINSDWAMQMAVNELPRKAINPLQFPVTHTPSTCQWCPFKKICWEE